MYILFQYFKDEIKTICCQNGLIKLQNIRQLQNYFTGSVENYKSFKDNVRSYNSAMAFASMGATVDDSVTGRYGLFCYRIHGQIYHRTGALRPSEGVAPQYAQLYILDSSEATNTRLGKSANRQYIRPVMEILQNLVQDINPFAALYKNILEFEHDVFERQNNTSRTNEFSNISTRRNCSNVSKFRWRTTITVHWKSGALENISILSKHCEPLCYPLLFPYGDVGWTKNMKKASSIQREVDEQSLDHEIDESNVLHEYSTPNISHLQWYAHRFAVTDEFNQWKTYTSIYG